MNLKKLIITPTESEVIFTSPDKNSRIVAYDRGTYSHFVLETKKEVNCQKLVEYIDQLEDNVQNALSDIERVEAEDTLASAERTLDKKIKSTLFKPRGAVDIQEEDIDRFMGILRREEYPTATSKARHTGRGFVDKD